MAVNLTLTDEQARWLERVMESKLSDYHWNSHRINPTADDREHCQTIKNKITHQLKAKEW